MSESAIPILLEMQEQLNKEAARSSELFKEQDLAPTVDDEPKEQQSIPPVAPASEEPVRLELPTTQLLSKPINIFASRPKSDPKPNIFTSRKSVNLFAVTANPQSAINIFSALTEQPPLLPNDDDSLSEASQHEHPADKDTPEPTVREMKFNYEGGMERLAEFKLGKFRAGSAATKEGVLLSIERDTKTESKNILYFLLKSEGSRIVLYHAFLPKGTVTSSFLGKPENVKLDVVKAKKEEERLATQREVVKMQFQTAEEAERFQKVLKEYFGSE